MERSPSTLQDDELDMCISGIDSILASANPDTRVLRRVLDHGKSRAWNSDTNCLDTSKYLSPSNPFGPNQLSFDQEGGLTELTSPLLQAIRSRHPRHVVVLLKEGADPNGVTMQGMSHNAASQLRFGVPFGDEGMIRIYSREDMLLGIGRQQLSPLTQDEIEERLHFPYTRFWSEASFRILDQIRHGASAPAMVEAAQSPCVEILEQIYSAKPDCSFWFADSHEIPVPATISSLALASPLHSAIWSRQSDMLACLLRLGFNPNTMPLAAVTRCVSPAMATILFCDPWNREAYYQLRAHPEIDFNRRTPIYNVHILHFAVARFELPVLHTISQDVSLLDAGKTALGHTLLHIACLPLNEAYIERRSEVIRKSIREIRSLSEIADEEIYNDYVDARTAVTSGVFDGLDYSTTPPQSLSGYFEAQTAVVKYIHGFLPQEISACDVYGNTGLHYLAGHRVVNTELLDWLKALAEGIKAWKEIRNRWGFTAEDLFLSEVQPNETSDWQSEKELSELNAIEREKRRKIEKSMLDGLAERLMKGNE